MILETIKQHIHKYENTDTTKKDVLLWPELMLIK